MLFKCCFLDFPLSQEASGGCRGASILSELCEDCIPALHLNLLPSTLCLPEPLGKRLESPHFHHHLSSLVFYKSTLISENPHHNSCASGELREYHGHCSRNSLHLFLGMVLISLYVYRCASLQSRVECGNLFQALDL